MDIGQPAPQALAAPDDDQAEAGADLICIKVAADGTLSVYKDGDAGPEQEQPAPGIGEALKIALSLYQSIGNSDESAGFDSVAAPPQTSASSAGMMRR